VSAGPEVGAVELELDAADGESPDDAHARAHRIVPATVDPEVGEVIVTTRLPVAAAAALCESLGRRSKQMRRSPTQLPPWQGPRGMPECSRSSLPPAFYVISALFGRTRPQASRISACMPCHGMTSNASIRIQAFVESGSGPPPGSSACGSYWPGVFEEVGVLWDLPSWKTYRRRYQRRSIQGYAGNPV